MATTTTATTVPSRPRQRRNELLAALAVLRPQILVVLFLSMLVNLLMLMPAIYMLQIYDRVLISYNAVTLLAVSLITLFLFAVMALCEWLRSRVLVRAGVRFDVRVGSRVFNASFDAHRAQSPLASQRVFNDLLQVRQFVTGPSIFALLDAPWAPLYALVAYLLHPVLGILAAVFILVQAALAWFGHRGTAARADAVAQASTELNRFLHTKLRNAEVMEVLGMAEPLRERWRERNAEVLARAAEAQAVTDRMLAWSKFVRYSQQALSLGVGALLVIRGELSPGAMIAANLLVARALAPIDQLVGVWRGFATTRHAYERLEELLRAFPEHLPAPDTELQGAEVRVKGLIARAAGRKAPILQDVSLELPAGSFTVVLGMSGSGKSTLARALLGAWPDVEGEVLIAGRPVASLEREALGQHVGYLPQEVELLAGSVAENIARFGDVDAEKVVEAARRAGLHEIILRFPRGYDTAVGQAGEVLSGGQRQRIALARALYGDPAVLVLDEPNAHLDDAGEQALQHTLGALKAAGKTVLVITHRTALLALADQVVILHEGKVKAQGPRNAVLAALAPAGPARPEPDASSLQPA